MRSMDVPRRPYPHSPEANVLLDLPDNEDPYAENNSKLVIASGARKACVI